MTLTVAEALPTLRLAQACSESIAWLESLPPDMLAEDAYNRCPNIVWLEWLAAKVQTVGILQRADIGRVACYFLDLVVPEGKEPALRHMLKSYFRGNVGAHPVLYEWEDAISRNATDRREALPRHRRGLRPTECFLRRLQ